VIRFGLLVCSRLLTAAVCVLTAGYAVLNCSPFAFEMFIRPQLFPWVTQFVSWHHLWSLLAYLAGAVTLGGLLSRRAPTSACQTAARWLAIAYLAIGGAIAALLVASPLLPRLWGDWRAPMTALAAFVPMAWLAVIDHLTSGARLRRGVDRPAGADQRRLMVTSAVVGGYLWTVHLARGTWLGDHEGRALAWALTAAWTLALSATLLACLYVLLCLLAALTTRGWTPPWRLHHPAAIILACGTCEFTRRVVLPTISIEPSSSAWISAVAGASLVAAASGVCLHWPRRPLASPARRVRRAPPLGALGGLALLACASCFTLAHLERLDWAFVGQKLIVLLEGTLAFAIVFGVVGRAGASSWSARSMVFPPALALLALVTVPRVALTAAAWTGDRMLEPAVLLEKYAAGEIAFKFMSDGLVDRAGADTGLVRFLQLHTNAGSKPVTVPDVDFTDAPGATRGSRPDVFVFVIDSLRRDYLSPYNSSVGFTPNIEDFSRGSYVFRNAFTLHGATQLAAPSIWAGAAMVRKVMGPGFERMNAIEKLLTLDGYRMAINDFTVASHLQPTTPVTTLDPGVPSVETDLCRNLESLETHMDATRGDARPLFGYLSPMNVHILNTRRGGQSSLDGDYPGFYAPYASRVRRMDACFGRFISFLEQRGRYDKSVIVLTSDHGDSLGEDQYWGHATWLFPEVVRLPLIVHLPPDLSATTTTDLTRVAFTADIAPTLYRLLGHPVRDLGPLFGSPLFVPPSENLADRRRASFLLTSSYGAAYGLLRNNGRSLYISDLVEWRDFAYDLSTGSVGKKVSVSPAQRRVNERLIREHVSRREAFYWPGH
jgi:hypothetical protein